MSRIQLLPPRNRIEAGEYVFYLCSDDEGALFLSSDESPTHKERIAWEPNAHQNRDWQGMAQQPNRENISRPIFLEAGKRYYVEALMKERVGEDYLSVTWQKPGEPPPKNGAPPIAGTYLACPISTEPTIASHLGNGK